ncbi:unnamed protein product [Fraxinus pennsylvanica]|uniref:BHLH domain-containing protein n=1 Tax=Fraxinus pennsylvanica TaxID=56036 RepID=A0AAD2DLI5_9LAMI|nr:unnamed protein product [Fraxinus pennsylvanica]
MILDCSSMEYVKTAFDDLCILDEEKTKGGRMEKREHIDSDDEDDKYKSNNLEAERRQRKKLNDRLLELRSSMNKATVVTDAVTYIEELQRHVKDLSHQLFEMDANFVEEEATKIEEIDSAEEMKIWGIEPEVQVTSIYGTKLWIKIVYQKTKGRFTKIMEAISVLGFDITDISVTTSKGAILVTSCVEDSIFIVARFRFRYIILAELFGSLGKGIALRTSFAFGPMQVAVSSPAPAPSENGVNWRSSGGPGIPLIRTNVVCRWWRCDSWTSHCFSCCHFLLHPNHQTKQRISCLSRDYLILSF